MLDEQDGVAAGQRLIACANPSTGRTGQRTNALQRTFHGVSLTANALDRRAPSRTGLPATNRLATETNAAERCDAADGASGRPRWERSRGRGRLALAIRRAPAPQLIAACSQVN